MFGKFRMIDLSVPLAHNAVSEPIPAEIHYVRHDDEGLQQMRQFFGVKSEDLVWSDGKGWALEEVRAITHTGTHVDAPYHYGPTSGGSRPRRSTRFRSSGALRPALCSICGTKPPANSSKSPTSKRPSVGSTTHHARWTSSCCKRAPIGDWIRSTTSRSRAWVAKVSLWLLDLGVKVIGIDAYTLDRPFDSMVKDFKRTGDGRFIWPAHFAGISREYCQIEKLANLDQIPVPHGFFVSCLPVKIEGASAGWCRAIALVPEESSPSTA